MGRPFFLFAVVLDSLLCILLLCSGPASAGRIPDDVAAAINRINGHLYDDEFEAARRDIDSLAAAGVDRPFVLLYRAMLRQSEMMARESDYQEEPFFAALDSLQGQAEAMLANGGDSVLAYFFLGHSHAFRSLYQGRAGHTWSALKKGLAARKAYSKGYALDSTFYDIALGLGSYRYWKSVKTKAINWTPLFKNEKQNGLRLLRLAADSAEISRDAAGAAIIWVYINEKRYGEAIHLADLMRRRYRHGLTFLWALGKAYFELGDVREAAEMYQELLTRLLRDPGNYYNIIEASYYLSKCYRDMGEPSEGWRHRIIDLQEKLAACPIPDDTRKRQKNRLKEIFKKP